MLTAIKELIGYGGFMCLVLAPFVGLALYALYVYLEEKGGE